MSTESLNTTNYNPEVGAHNLAPTTGRKGSLLRLSPAVYMAAIATLEPSSWTAGQANVFDASNNPELPLPQQSRSDTTQSDTAR